MKEASILILTLIILLTLRTNDIIFITLLGILIFVFAFIFCFNIHYYVGKYLRKREEEKKFELLLKRIENELKKIPSN